LGEEQAGDQKAGQHEEDVNADVSTLEKGDARVIEDHEQDRDRSEALDVVTVP
jgi:hypothetical protein